jgi:hypothetical protein
MIGHNKVQKVISANEGRSRHKKRTFSQSSRHLDNNRSMSEKLFDGLWICTTGLEVHVKVRVCSCMHAVACKRALMPLMDVSLVYAHVQEQIRKIVLACGGTFDDDLALDSTTHLIADAVGSQKHRVCLYRCCSLSS